MQQYLHLEIASETSTQPEPSSREMTKTPRETSETKQPIYPSVNIRHLHFQHTAGRSVVTVKKRIPYLATIEDAAVKERRRVVSISCGSSNTHYENARYQSGVNQKTNTLQQR